MSKYKEFFNNGKYKMEYNGDDKNPRCRIVSLTDDYRYYSRCSKEEFFRWAYNCYIKERSNKITVISLEDGLQTVFN